MEQAVTSYRGYLMEPANRLCDPAGGMNIVPVGAVVHGNELGPQVGQNVAVRAITKSFGRLPVTRAGPGVRGTIKPDFVDAGGTLVFDGLVARLRGVEELPEAGVLWLATDRSTGCSLRARKPRTTARLRSRQQTGAIQVSRDASGYGDNCYLAVRCSGGWADLIGKPSQ